MVKDKYIDYIIEVLIKQNKMITCRSAFEFHLTDQNRPKPTRGVTQFKEYWKIAEERHKKALHKLNKAKEDISITAELNAVKETTITRIKMIESYENEILEYEKIIAKGWYAKKVNIDGKEHFVKEVFSTKELKDWNFMLEVKRKALKELQGFDAPTKIEQTIKDKRQGFIGYEIE